MPRLLSTKDHPRGIFPARFDLRSRRGKGTKRCSSEPRLSDSRPPEIRDQPTTSSVSDRSEPVQPNYRSDRSQSNAAAALLSAASSRSRPVLSPCEINCGRLRQPFDRPAGEDSIEPYNTDLVLTDCGYMTPGLEPLERRIHSRHDGGGHLSPEPYQRTIGPNLSRLTSSHQYSPATARSSRWSSERTEGNLLGYPGRESRLSRRRRPALPADKTAELAATPTRLKAWKYAARALINWATPSATLLRCYFDPALPAPPGFPYPRRAFNMQAAVGFACTPVGRRSDVPARKAPTIVDRRRIELADGTPGSKQPYTPRETASARAESHVARCANRPGFWRGCTGRNHATHLIGVAHGAGLRQTVAGLAAILASHAADSHAEGEFFGTRSRVALDSIAGASS